MRARDEFIVNAVILTVVVFVATGVILGTDGIAAVWNLIFG